MRARRHDAPVDRTGEFPRADAEEDLAMTVKPDDGLLVQVGSGARRYREYLWKALGHRRTWLVNDEPAEWQLPYLHGHSTHPSVARARSTENADALVSHVEQLAERHRITGFLTFDEMLVGATARLADRFGTAGLTAGGAANCRDKHRTRRALTDAGIRQPRFHLVKDQAEARRAAIDIGFPVIVKPRGLAGSVGVQRADDPREVDAAVAAAIAAGGLQGPTNSGGLLVEEMLDGPEISVDGAVQGGTYLPALVARKQVGLPPAFEEIGHVVDAADGLLDDADLLSMLGDAHRALGLRDGMTHTEVKLTRRGPVIVEVNGRLGGDLIPLLGYHATGINFAEVAADVAQSRPVRLERRHQRTAGIRFCYPPFDGALRTLSLPAVADTPGLVNVDRLVPDGTTLRLPPRGYLSRYAYVITEAADPASCSANLDKATAAITAVFEPAA
jgi:hypothetical protein